MVEKGCYFVCVIIVNEEIGVVVEFDDVGKYLCCIEWVCMCVGGCDDVEKV